jgi:hypothetical protein
MDVKRICHEMAKQVNAYAAKDDMSRQLATPAANCRLYEKENESSIGQ